MKRRQVSKKRGERSRHVSVGDEVDAGDNPGTGEVGDSAVGIAGDAVPGGAAVGGRVP